MATRRYIGIDLAGSATNTAIAVLETKEDSALSSATVWTQKQFVDHRLPMTAPTDDDDDDRVLVRCLDAYAAENAASVLAIDAPFGFPHEWPDDWSAAVPPRWDRHRHSLSLDAEVADSIFFRSTEKCLGADGIRPLSAVADRLIIPATRACWSLLPLLEEHGWSPIRAANGPRSEERSVIEVYPRAARKLVGGTAEKSWQDQKANIFLSVAQHYCGAVTDAFRAQVEGEVTSPHKLDALIAAFVAFLWRIGKTAGPCTHDDPHLPHSGEGWIQVPGDL